MFHDGNDPHVPPAEVVAFAEKMYGAHVNEDMAVYGQVRSYLYEP